MKKWLKTKTFWILVVIAIAGVFYLTQSGKEKGLEVLTTKPVKQTLNQIITVSGQLQAIDSDIIRITAGTQIDTVAVKEGDQVRKGQLLASGDTADLALQKERLLLTKAQIERDIAEISKPTKKSVETGIQSRITQASSTVSTLEVKLADAKKRLDDTKSLYQSGSASKSELDSQSNLVTELTNQLQGARANLNALLAERSDINPDQALRLTALDTQLQQVQVDLNRIEENMQRITYISTVDGTVTRVIPVAGRTAGPDTYIRIDNLTGYQVESYVPQEDALYLSVGQKATITVKGKSDAWGAVVTSVGQYAAVEAASGSQAPRVRVLLELDKPSDSPLPVGFEAEATIVVGTASDAWTIVREAIRFDSNDMPYVWIVVDGKVQMKAITVQLMDDARAAVSGMDGTEMVVALPNETLSEGSSVTAQEVPK